MCIYIYIYTYGTYNKLSKHYINCISDAERVAHFIQKLFGFYSGP